MEYWINISQITDQSWEIFSMRKLEFDVCLTTTGWKLVNVNTGNGYTLMDISIRSAPLLYSYREISFQISRFSCRGKKKYLSSSRRKFNVGVGGQRLVYTFYLWKRSSYNDNIYYKSQRRSVGTGEQHC